MAHLPLLREFARHPHRVCAMGWRRAWAAARPGLQRLPAACPLCRIPSPGPGLCTACEAMVLHTMRSRQRRCGQCCLTLRESDDEATGSAACTTANVCSDCRATAPAYQRIIAAFDYDAPGDMLIHRFKAERCFALAPVLSGLLADAVRCASPALPAQLVLVSVPASRQGVVQRGFNPSAEIAQGLAHCLCLPHRPQYLSRFADGHKQATLGRDRRMMGTAGLYEVHGDVRGAHIALVDDVLTTGSTLHGIARLFRRAGAAAVYGLVLARTPVL